MEKYGTGVSVGDSRPRFSADRRSGGTKEVPGEMEAVEEKAWSVWVCLAPSPLWSGRFVFGGIVFGRHGK